MPAICVGVAPPKSMFVVRPAVVCRFEALPVPQQRTAPDVNSAQLLFVTAVATIAVPKLMFVDVDEPPRCPDVSRPQQRISPVLMTAHDVCLLEIRPSGVGDTDPARASGPTNANEPAATIAVNNAPSARRRT